MYTCFGKGMSVVRGESIQEFTRINIIIILESPVILFVGRIFALSNEYKKYPFKWEYSIFICNRQ